MNAIEERRLALGLSIKELAEKAGTAGVNVTNAEMGRARNQEAIAKIASALGMSTEEALEAVATERARYLEVQREQAECNRQEFELRRRMPSRSVVPVVMGSYEIPREVSTWTDALGYAATLLPRDFERAWDVLLSCDAPGEFRLRIYGEPSASFASRSEAPEAKPTEADENGR